VNAIFRWGGRRCARSLRNTTREAGLRELERQTSRSWHGKMARRLVESGQAPASGRKAKASRVTVTADDLAKLLGPPKFIPTSASALTKLGSPTAWRGPRSVAKSSTSKRR